MWHLRRNYRRDGTERRRALEGLYSQPVTNEDATYMRRMPSMVSADVRTVCDFRLRVELKGTSWMSAELLDHIVSGAIYDLAAFLTTRPERVVCSSRDNAAPLVDAVREFLEKAGVDTSCEPSLEWKLRCSNGRYLQRTI